MHPSDLEPLRPLAIAIGCIAAVIAGTWHVKRVKPPFNSGKPQEPGMYLVKIQPTDIFEQYSYFDGFNFHQTAETAAAALEVDQISKINWYWKRVKPSQAGIRD